MLFLLISLTTAIPKFTYILADDISKNECKKIKHYLEDYFKDGIYTDFDKQQAKEISQAFQGFLCTYDGFDIEDAFAEVNKDTELLLLDALEIDDEVNFAELKKKMVVYIYGIDPEYLTILSSDPEEMAKDITSRFSSTFKNMFSISYNVNSQSKNIELSKLISKSRNTLKRHPYSSNLLEIEGSMKNKVSFLAIFNQYELKFEDDDVDCENLYLYQCDFSKRKSDPIKIKSQIMLVDPYTYSKIKSSGLEIKVDQFGIILDRKNTIRISFSAEDVKVQFSDISFPDNNEQYSSLLAYPIPLSWFETICILSESTQYSLYLDNLFNPKRQKLPGINISINKPDTARPQFQADKQNVEIKTESWTQGAWDQFQTKPTINIDADPNTYNINAPDGITVTNNEHAGTTKKDNKKKTLIIIIVCVCVVAVIVIIVVVVVVIKCRNKYNSKIVYINNDEHQNQPTLTGENSFKDDMKEEKELSDEDEKEKLEAEEQNNGANSNENENTQSHEELNQAQSSYEYPQPGQSHPAYPAPNPQQITPTGSNTNLPTDTPNSAYTVPF